MCCVALDGPSFYYFDDTLGYGEFVHDQLYSITLPVFLNSVGYQVSTE
jgi:hypothetical protein